MNHSADITELAKALANAQPKIRIAVKASDNPYYKSKYADLPTVWDACKEALHENGLTVIQGGEQGDGHVLNLSTMLLHTSGQWIEGTFTLPLAKPDPQGVGSAITYARRYGLQAICGVMSDDDDDGNAASHTPEPKKDNTRRTPKTREDEVPGTNPIPPSTTTKPDARRKELIDLIAQIVKQGQFLGTLTESQISHYREKVKAASGIQELQDLADRVRELATPGGGELKL